MVLRFEGYSCIHTLNRLCGKEAIMNAEAKKVLNYLIVEDDPDHTKIIASSPEFVGEFWLREVSELVI